MSGSNVPRLPKTPIIFPHLPKCGGTSILRALQNSGVRCFLDYDHPPSHRRYFSDLCRRRNDEFSLLDFSPFDVVYGHFPLSRYNASPDRIVLVLRHPAERAISHYFYFRDILPLTNAPALYRTPEIADIKAGKIGLVDFARELRIFDFYRDYVERMDTRDFCLVGFTDDLELFSERLRVLTGINLGRLGHERANPNKPSIDELTELETVLSDEIGWYQAQRDLWLARTSRVPIARSDTVKRLDG